MTKVISTNHYQSVTMSMFDFELFIMIAWSQSLEHHENMILSDSMYDFLWKLQTDGTSWPQLNNSSHPLTFDKGCWVSCDLATHLAHFLIKNMLICGRRGWPLSRSGHMWLITTWWRCPFTRLSPESFLPHSHSVITICSPPPHSALLWSHMGERVRWVKNTQRLWSFHLFQ